MTKIIIKKVIEMDSPRIENLVNKILPVKRMKLIDRYFPCISKL